MKRLIAASVLAAAGAVCTVTAELYRYSFCRNRGWLLPLVRKDSKGHDEAYYIARDAAAERLKDRPCEKMAITSERGDKLCGWYYKAGEDYSLRIAVIIHGYRSEHLETLGLYSDYYFSRGIDIFCADNTAAGESGGEIIGYDVFESRDSLRWIAHLHARFPKSEMLLHGFSMGGATVLKLSSLVPDYVKFIIDDCGFSSAQELLKRSLGIFYQPVRLLNKIVAGYELEDSDVRQSLKAAKAPILFFHGEEDRLVPFNMGEQLYELCPTEKQAHFVPGARHVESKYIDPEGYAGCIDSFIEKYMQ